MMSTNPKDRPTGKFAPKYVGRVSHLIHFHFSSFSAHELLKHPLLQTENEQKLARMEEELKSHREKERQQQLRALQQQLEGVGGGGGKPKLKRAVTM